MKQRAQTVIVGAGIVGVSAAAELARRGHGDVVVIEQAELFRTGGSSSHAPGGVFQNNASRTVSKLAQWTVDTFREVSAEGDPTYFPVGSLEIATTEARWRDLHRKYGYARSWGLNARLLTPGEVAELWPLIDTAKILGAIQVEGDGVVRSIPTVERLAARAVSDGAEFEAHTQFLGVSISDGRVQAVQTSKGEIVCENLLLCGGIWGPLLGELTGIPVPLQPCAHPLVRSTPLSEFAGLQDVQLPIWRHQDHSMYLCQDQDHLAVGNYRHEPTILSAGQIDNSTKSPAEIAWDESVMALGWTEAQRLVPTLRGAEIASRVHGLFSFTPDSQSLIGEVAGVKGLWTAMAIWVTHSAGSGRMIADLMTTGDCELDWREVDVNRFAGHQTSPGFIAIRGAQQYREVYDIIHPRYQISTPRGLRRAPWYEQQVALGAHFYESNGWERAQWYDSNAELPLPANRRDDWSAIEWSPIAGAEHIATRTKAGLFDLSTFMRIEISGSDARTLVHRLASGHVDRPLDKVSYSALLTPSGGVLSDLTMMRLGEDRYLLLTGSGSGPRDLGWIVSHARDLANVEIRDITSAHCALGLWGPRARTILAPILEGDLSAQGCPPYSDRPVFVAGIPVWAVRMSYVGEDGFELHCSREYGGALWDALWTTGTAQGLVAAGGAAMDTLRLERGFRALGTDLRSEYSPDEAGIQHAIDRKRCDYLGAEALRTRPITKQLCTMVLDNPEVVLLGKEPIISADQVIGYVSSAGFGYTIEKSLAVGYLPVELANPGTPVELEYFGERYQATVVLEPLYEAPAVS